ncbi:unnamed protein product, partial [Phaeothamnion confervicola]
RSEAQEEEGEVSFDRCRWRDSFCGSSSAMTSAASACGASPTSSATAGARCCRSCASGTTKRTSLRRSAARKGFFARPSSPRVRRGDTWAGMGADKWAAMKGFINGIRWTAGRKIVRIAKMSSARLEEPPLRGQAQFHEGCKGDSDGCRKGNEAR